MVFNFCIPKVLLLILHSSAKIEVELTVEILDPILKKVKRVIVIAIKDVKALVHLDTNSILKTVTGLLDLHGLAKLLCDVLTVCALISVGN